MARRSPEERSRRRFARRQWTRRWLSLRKVAVVALVAAVVGGAVYAVYFSPLLRAEQVRVDGIESLRDADVLRVAGVDLGGPLATIDTDLLERRIASLPAVQSVRVVRQWPHEVRIVVEERTPVAVVLRGGTLRAVDATGALFNTYRQAPPDLPRIEIRPGVGESGAVDTDALREAAAVVGAVPPDLRAQVDHLDLASADAIDLALRDGRTVRWGSADGSPEKAQVLGVLLAQPGDVYDVSVPGNPTVS